MPRLTAETVRNDGVSFVEILLEADRPHSVQLTPCFDGPIWPPRNDGEPTHRWTDAPVSVEIDAGTTAIGFATPSDVDGSPVEIVDSEPRSEPLPGGIEAWIERVEKRIAAAEPLCAVEDLHAAADVIESLGGLSAVETLIAAIERDRRLASKLSFVPDTLCERLDSIEIPVGTFARIASA
jgi:hypothetical protein